MHSVAVCQLLYYAPSLLGMFKALNIDKDYSISILHCSLSIINERLENIALEMIYIARNDEVYQILYKGIPICH